MQLRLKQQHFYCDYCTSRYFPEKDEDGIRILDEDSDITCPVCKIQLIYGFIGDTQLNYCKSCRGMLINQDSFLELIEFLREEYTQPPIKPPPVDFLDLERRLTCPTCYRSMSTHLYGGPGNLVVDNCIQCLHLWLDYNEFSRIIRSPGRKRRSEEVYKTQVSIRDDNSTP